MKKIRYGFCIAILTIIANFQINAQDFVRGTFKEGGLSNFQTADFDKDGKNDLVGISYYFSSPSEIEIYMNTSDSAGLKFEPMVIGSFDNINGAPAVGDYDGDDDIDIVFTLSESKDIYIYKNNGDNTFTQEETGLSGANRLKFIDLEGDGDLDLIGHVNNDNFIATFMNDGNGIFTAGPITEHVNDIAFVDYGDIDGDGDQDFALAIENFSGETVAIYLNDGINTFSKVSSADINALNNAVQVKIVDIDNDGKMDVCGLNDKKLVAFLQNETLGFVTKELIDPPTSGDLSTFIIDDFDGNGLLDVVIGDYTEELYWFENQALIFIPREAGGVRPVYNMLSDDFDLDGDVDFVVTNGDFHSYRNEIEQLPSSLEKINLLETNVYPNPVTDHVVIDIEGEGEFKAELFSNGGLLLSTQSLRNSNILDLSDLPSGIYTLKVVDSKRRSIQTQKLTKI